MTGRRPDPEALLERVREEERRAGRGRLKIFFGASPGVGKTYTMLEDARAKRRNSVDVVVGLVETHGRADTAVLLEGLDVLPRRSIDYRGVTLSEFDLDAALARRPAILLVDELAHTNAPGSRHARRFQDVQELLAAGINVYTTLNVQHIESLNDVVAQITGVAVRETVPDSIFDEADELEIADLTAEDLLQRLKDGKVYVPEQAMRAVDQFFRKGNLIALRELTLRRAAQRVDAQMRGYMREHGIRETWPAGERLLVCVGPNPASARLIRSGKRMATGLQADWVVMFVEAPGLRISASDREQLARNLQLAQELGAQTVSVGGVNVADEILAYAREHNVTKILVGKPTHPRWRDRVFGSVHDQLVRGSGHIDVYVITGEIDEPRRAPPRPEDRRVPVGEYLQAALILALCTALGLLVFPRYLTLTDVAMLFVLATGVVAYRYSRAPTVLAAFLAIVLFDFFFVPPRYTFAVSDARYVLTFAVMLSIALLISMLTLRVRAQAEMARARERGTAALYAMTRELAATRGVPELTAVAARHIHDTFGAPATVLLPAPGGGRGLVLPADEKERSVAQWVLDRGQRAGAGSDTLPAARGLYVPLATTTGTIGVLGVTPVDPRQFRDPTALPLLETFARQIAVALERDILADRTQREQLEIEAERLRTSLLSSVSHDLRTPLATISGAASSLLESAMAEPTRRELLRSILAESQRMNRLIGNLLDMIRLDSGSLQVNKQWQSLEEIVGVALIRLDERLRGRQVTVALPPDLPLVPMDEVLIEQVFVNLLENAARYTPAGTPIQISAAVVERAVRVDVADHGPGIPPGEEERIFEKFRRGTQDAGGGVGLGLTICRGIVTAHGGRIWAANRVAGGAIFHFTLPLGSTPPPSVPGEPGDE
ncbi:MAG TPA: sensor histidine kinase KdpD [Gemmatimonadales bacterium]|nr:sensor histidine kinase KdpD [Gemmatimonadales bacterium]